MSKPRPPGLPADIEALLEAERHLPPAPSAVESRIRARVAGTLTAAGGIGAAGSASATASSGAGAAAATATAAKAGLLAVASAKSALLVVAVSIAATTGGVVLHHRSQMARRSSQPTIVAASTTVPKFAGRALPPVAPPTAAPPAAAPSVELSRPPVVEARRAPLERELGDPHGAGANIERAPAAIHSASEPSLEASRVGDENRLLAAALAALGRNAPDQALDALAEHARHFPHGLLEEEREALWIRALVARGDADAARARAEKFRTRFPASIQNRMISSALATIPR